MERKRTICDICCPSFHCGIDAYVKDGQLVKIEGTAEHPQNHGLLCAKGLAARQYVYRKDRIRTPLLRMGERGRGEFRPISWGEAYERIAERLLAIREESGPEAVTFFSGYTKWYRPWLHRLANQFGTPNYMTESGSCMFSTFLQWLTVTGNVMSAPDVDHAGVFLGWAYNPYYSRNLAAAGVEAAKKRGMKVIIVDSRITPASIRLSDLHLRPHPGTDGALALGLAHELIENGWYDREYVSKYVYGFAEYAAYVKEFTPERVERLTGVSAEQVRSAAELIGGHLPLAINESAAPIAHHRNGFQNYRAIMALSAITGSFDRTGGQIPIQFSYNYQAAGFATREKEFVGKVKTRPGFSPVGGEKYPLWHALIDEAQFTDLARQIREKKPYPLRAVVGFGLNHRIAPGSDRLAEALKTLDFLVDVDLFLTDTAKLCDIVLPACTSFERSELKAWSGGYLTVTQPVIEPLYQSKPDIRIICELARKMGLADELLTAGPEACIRYLISDLPVSYEELRAAELPVKVPGAGNCKPGKMLAEGFPTASGKFELYSLEIAKIREQYPDCSLDCLPVYREPICAAEQEKYPFTLCSGPRIPGALHSRLHGVPWARSLRPDATADLNPADAEALSVQQGDEIEVYTALGCISLKANLTYMVDPGTVYIYHGYPEADVNTLLDPENVDPYSGFPAFRSSRAGIRKKVR